MDKTVVKGLKLVEALGRSPRPRGIAELAAELDLGRSNVHRLLDTLVESGYVKRHPEGRYELTLKLWEIGATVLDRLDVRVVARAPMEWLAERTGESVHLGLLDGGEIVYIDRIQGSSPVSAVLRIGGRAPAHRVASGKALLSGLAPDAFEKFCKGISLPPAEHKALANEVERIRKAGYSLNFGAYRKEVSGAGAPIFGARGQLMAAIGIAGPIARLTRTRLTAFAAKEVKEAARRISATLGGASS